MVGGTFKPVPLGTRFGKLTVIGQDFKDKQARRIPCRCDCGRENNPHSFSLSGGKSLSCGKCKTLSATSKALVGDAQRTHGYSRKTEYNSWTSMRKRCLDPSNRQYPDYGGRGITVCDEWKNSFENFLAYMGEKPEKSYSLDRIDNNRGYEPGNVRWASKETQSRNRRAFVMIPGTKTKRGQGTALDQDVLLLALEIQKIKRDKSIQSANDALREYLKAN